MALCLRHRPPSVPGKAHAWRCALHTRPLLQPQLAAAPSALARRSRRQEMQPNHIVSTADGLAHQPARCLRRCRPQRTRSTAHRHLAWRFWPLAKCPWRRPCWQRRPPELAPVAHAPRRSCPARVCHPRLPQRLWLPCQAAPKPFRCITTHPSPSHRPCLPVARRPLLGADKPTRHLPCKLRQGPLELLLDPGAIRVGCRTPRQHQRRERHGDGWST